MEGEKGESTRNSEAELFSCGLPCTFGRGSWVLCPGICVRVSGAFGGVDSRECLVIAW